MKRKRELVATDSLFFLTHKDHCRNWQLTENYCCLKTQKIHRTACAIWQQFTIIVHPFTLLKCNMLQHPFFLVKALTLCLLLFIGATNGQSQTQNYTCAQLKSLANSDLSSATADSINTIASQVKSSKTCTADWLLACLKIASAYKSAGLHDSVVSFSSKALNNATAADDDSLWHEMQFMQNEGFVYTGAFDKGIPLAKELLTYYQQQNNIAKEYQIRKRLLYYYSNTSKANECIAMGLETRSWMNKNTPEENQAPVINYMASSYLLLKDYTTTKLLVEEALDLNPPFLVLIDLKTKSLLSLYNESNTDSAQLIINDLLQEIENESPASSANILYNLAAITYNNNDYTTTIKLISKAETPEIQKTLRQDELMSFMALKGSSLIAIKNYKEGLKYIHEALPIAMKIDDTGTLLVLYERLATAYIYMNIPDSASKYNLAALAIKESIFNRNKAEALQDIERKYETQLKQKTIEVQEAEITAQKKLNNQQSIIIWISIVALIVVLVMAVLLQKSNHVKQKNLQLAIEQKTQIAKQSEERELLLKEIHHRVKNNLQIISNLLELQAMKSEGDASAVLLDGQLRVQAMAMIHQKLYQQDNVAELNFKEYLTQMQGHWKMSFEAETNAEIMLNCEGIFLDIDTAIPLGLIINELITNAYKHAFYGIEQPQIAITMRQIESGSYELKVQDNGIGFHKDISELKSLGMRLVQRLSKQISGDLSIESIHGALFTIRFKNSLLRQLIE